MATPSGTRCTARSSAQLTGNFCSRKVLIHMELLITMARTWLLMQPGCIFAESLINQNTMKQFFALIAACVLAISPSFAQDAGDDFTEYGVGLCNQSIRSISNLTYNVDAKRPISAGFKLRR